MSGRVVLAGVSSRMPWSATGSAAVSSPSHTTVAAAVAPPKVDLRPPTPPQPLSSSSPAGTSGWSDKKCGDFLLGRLDRALRLQHLQQGPMPEPSQFWEIFLMLKSSGGEIGAETSNAMLRIMARIGSVDSASDAVRRMEGCGVDVLPLSGSELVAAYVRRKEYRLALDTLKHFAHDKSDPARRGMVDATFHRLEAPTGAENNLFARALLEKLTQHSKDTAELGEATHDNFISVAKGSCGGASAWQVLQRMKRTGKGDLDTSDAYGSLSWACGLGSDVGGSQKMVSLAEKRDNTNTECYEGLALAYQAKQDVDGAGTALDRFNASGHSVDTASFLLETVASTAAPHAMKGDKKAKNVVKRVYETTLLSTTGDNGSLSKMLRKVVDS